MTSGLVFIRRIENALGNGDSDALRRLFDDYRTTPDEEKDEWVLTLIMQALTLKARLGVCGNARAESQVAPHAASQNEGSVSP